MPKTVLIADASQFFSTAISSVLTTLGYRVVGATSEKSEVVALARKNRPDLLILDYGMVSENTGKQLKEQLPEMKIFVLGFEEAFEGFIEEILRAGFDGFWNKYDDRGGFLEALNTIFP